jgi:hypothetical protein
MQVLLVICLRLYQDSLHDSRTGCTVRSTVRYAPVRLFSLITRFQSAHHDFSDMRLCYSFLETYISLRSVAHTSVINKKGLDRCRVFGGHHLHKNYARRGPERNLALRLLTFL